MKLDPDTCYQTLLARDRRFDGWFFVGVSSTGIYCRPVCPVRTPKRQNCHFFLSAAVAEKAGFRPCLRCRPELAPGHGLLDVSAQLARSAATLIEEGFLNTAGIPELAARVGVTDRHLRRIFDTEYGVSIVEFAQTQRLLMAKRLLTDTCLPVTQVALAAGFGSVRRFNDLFLHKYGLNPRRFRKTIDTNVPDIVSFALGYRPPFCWSEVLAFLKRAQIDGVEKVGDGCYERAVEIKRGERSFVGWISVTNDSRRFMVNVTMPTTLIPVLTEVLAGVRRTFDLSARPDLIDTHLGDLAAGYPGMRVPGAFNGFEIAVRAVVGQQRSLSDTPAILSRVAERFGTEVTAHDALTRTFPSVVLFSRLPLSALEETGITRAHAEAIVALADEILTGRLMLEPAAPLESTLHALRRIRGLSEWAVQYIAMRALGWPNAFPEDDAVLKEPLCHSSVGELSRRASQWQPWRAYAMLHVWRRSKKAR
ncbi:DNA-3-methyladenine glycosylase 2 family protein [Paraburkholderia antibiotica]|uniref:Helix-turn-helix domain-containing protein n=1 Tax=Paraburkholderia antibiotica TaxID=2728839 RepID=A0A7Y0FG47_9BURK|nr:DNA-3-methyladenine glycosylase 2 family protein [Paraburkholderia antibiotica]NML34787.1 helix-turn-helix domain-containing protein [Paraburkholderia antibiotica]